MYLYAIAVVIFIGLIISLVRFFINFKKSQNTELTEEEIAKFKRKYKNDLFFFALFAVICEVIVLIANKVVKA